MTRNQLNRRHFLAMTGIFTTASTLTGRAEEEKDDSPDLDWGKVQNANEFTVKCERFRDDSYPDIQLHVALKPRKPDSDAESWNVPNVTRFDLVWNKQKVEIPGRFWQDIERMPLQLYPSAEIAKIPQNKRWKIENAIKKPPPPTPLPIRRKRHRHDRVDARRRMRQQLHIPLDHQQNRHRSPPPRNGVARMLVSLRARTLAKFTKPPGVGSASKKTG